MKLDACESMSLWTRATLSSEASGLSFFVGWGTAVTCVRSASAMFLHAEDVPTVPSAFYALPGRRNAQRRASRCRFFVTGSEA
jgi:hypothetical protein